MEARRRFSSGWGRSLSVTLGLSLAALGAACAQALSAPLQYDGALVSPSGSAFADGDYWVVFGVFEEGSDDDSPLLVHAQIVHVSGGNCVAELERDAAELLPSGAYWLAPLQALSAAKAVQASTGAGEEPAATQTGLDADMVDGIHARTWPKANCLLALDDEGRFPNRALHMGPGGGLNADFVDGFHANQFAPKAHNHDWRYVNVDGDTMTGALSSTVAEGTAPFSVASTTVCPNLNADLVDGMHASDLGGTHNHDGLYVNVDGDTMSGQLNSTVAEGTAPISVASTTVCPNLNADLLDGLTAAQIMDGASVPSGTIVMWSGTTIPTGWHRFTALDGLFPRGAATYGGTGGSETHAHTFSGTTGYAYQPGQPSDYNLELNHTHDHVHDFSGTTASGSSLPPYLEVIFIQKD